MISVRVTGTDRRHWPPEVEFVFGLHSGDEAVSGGQIYKRKQTGRIPQVKTLGLGHHAGDAGPPGRRVFIPETRDGRLLRRSDCAVLLADLLHLIVVTCVAPSR